MAVGEVARFGLFLLHADGRWLTGGRVVFSCLGQGHSVALPSVQLSFCPSVLRILSHSAALCEATSSPQSLSFFHPGRMHMDEVKAEAPGDDKQTSSAQVDCQYDKGGCHAGCSFLFHNSDLELL